MHPQEVVAARVSSAMQHHHLDMLLCSYSQVASAAAMVQARGLPMLPKADHFGGSIGHWCLEVASSPLVSHSSTPA